MARAAASAADTPAEATPDDAAEIDAAAEPTPSYTRAQAYVGQRIARGSWTEQDRDALSAEIDGMTVRERRDVMAQLIRATNQDKLRLELRGPLF